MNYEILLIFRNEITYRNKFRRITLGNLTFLRIFPVQGSYRRITTVSKPDSITLELYNVGKCRNLNECDCECHVSNRDSNINMTTDPYLYGLAF